MSESTSGSPGKLPKPLLIVAALILACIALLAPLAWATIQRGMAAIDAPRYQMDNEEGALLFQAMELREGRSIYRPLRDYPYYVGTYPPVYLAMNAVFADRSEPNLSSGRIISLVSCLVTSIMLVLICYGCTRRILPSILAGVLFLATYETCHWVAYYRVDMTGLALTTAGFACFIWWPHRRAGAAAALVLLVLGFFTRQTLVAAPIAIAVATLTAGSHSERGAFVAWRGARWGMYLAAAVAAPFLAFTALTRGQFALHTIYYNMNTFIPDDVFRWARHFWTFSGGLVLAGVTGIGLLGREAWRDRHSAGLLVDTRKRAVLIYACLAGASGIMIGKSGSAENYLLEPIIGLSLAACCSIAWAVQSGHRVWTRVAVASLPVLLLLAHAGRLNMQPIRTIAFQPWNTPHRADLAAAARVIDLVRAESGGTWTELAMINLLAGQPMHFQPFIMSELARQGRWNPSGFYADLAKGKFRLLVSNYDFASGAYTNVYTPEMIGIVSNRFSEVDRVTFGRQWKYFIYRYR